MTTTYELYTNDDGTPKLVEGKAPAIIERVEALEENSLPKSGGTLKGPLDLNTGTLANRVVDTSFLQINGGSAWNSGASIELRGKDAETNPGQFYVRTVDGTNTKNLSLKPDGTFTWDNKSVITNNWANAWVIDRDLGHIHKANNTGSMVIRGGGSADANGAKLQLYGSENSSVKGDFTLMANDGTQGKTLRGKADGTLTWNSSNIVRSVWGHTANSSGDVTPSFIEFTPESNSNNGGYIDFHFNGSSSDFTSRIIEGSSGALQISATNGVTINAKNVVRSVNGSTADASGNVTISTGGGTSAYQIPYGTSSTSPTTKAKVATITNGTSFSLVVGAIVAIRFTSKLYGDEGSSTYQFTTLNVNSTGAKNVKTWTTGGLAGGIQAAYNVYVFVYDGTYWNLVTVGKNWYTYDSGGGD